MHDQTAEQPLQCPFTDISHPCDGRLHSSACHPLIEEHAFRYKVCTYNGKFLVVVADAAHIILKFQLQQANGYFVIIWLELITLSIQYPLIRLRFFLEKTS
jgi:hypothetical protein